MRLKSLASVAFLEGVLEARSRKSLQHVARPDPRGQFSKGEIVEFYRSDANHAKDIASWRFNVEEIDLEEHAAWAGS
eukprot:14902691-Heterocapsa_arctica.AAC.1